MASASKVGEGIYAVKLRLAGGSFTVTLPPEIRGQAGFLPGHGFIALRVVGKAVVLVQVTEGTIDGIKQQSEKAIDESAWEWIRERSDQGDEKAEAGNGEAGKANGRSR